MLRLRLAVFLRRWADWLAPGEVTAVEVPGLSDPLQVALRIVIASTRGDDIRARIDAAYAVLRRVDESVLPSVVIHLAVMLAQAGTSSESTRRWAQRELGREQFRELLKAGVLGGEGL